MQLLTRLQFYICYAIKTRVGFKIAEITRLLNYTGSYSFALQKWNHHFFTAFLNKFLKHVFNSILKLNNHLWEKVYTKSIFCGKNGAQISGFSVEKPLVLEKKIKKKYVQHICADKIFKTVWANFLKNWFSRYLTFSEFTVLKNRSSP